MYTRYTTTVRNNVCCKFILEYNQLEKDSISPNP